MTLSVGDLVWVNGDNTPFTIVGVDYGKGKYDLGDGKWYERSDIIKHRAGPLDFYAKMAGAMGEIGKINFDAENAFHGYKYAKASSVMYKVQAALAKRGLACGTSVEVLQHTGPSCVIKMRLTVTDGIKEISSEGIGQGQDKGDKAAAKATTSALKYALSSMFLISWSDEDIEADTGTDVDAYIQEISGVTSKDALQAVSKTIAKVQAKIKKADLKRLRDAYDAKDKELCAAV